MTSLKELIKESVISRRRREIETRREYEKKFLESLKEDFKKRDEEKEEEDKRDASSNIRHLAIYGPVLFVTGMFFSNTNIRKSFFAAGLATSGWGAYNHFKD